MPVNPALKQRLVQKFQQKQQQDSLAAQASIAAAHSNEQPRSSGSKDEAAVVQGISKPPAPPVTAPPTAAIQRPAVLALDKPKTLDVPNKKNMSSLKPAPAKQQEAQVPPSQKTQQPTLGVKRDRDQAPVKPRQGAPAPSSTSQHQQQQQQNTGSLQKQPSLKKTKSINLLPPPNTTSEPAATAPPILKFKKVETIATTHLEILSNLDGKVMPRPAGHIPAPSFASYSELWTAVRRVCGDQVTRTTARLCYQDSEDDWIALLPGTPFSFFTKSVKKVLVVPLKKEFTLLK